MVVVAIIGVLAAVAIPAYNNYRINAAQASLTSLLNNIGKAYVACLTLRATDQCDSLQEIGASCSNCDNVGGTGANFCADAAVVVGAMEYKGCVASTGGIHSVLGNWPRRCDEFGVIYDCTSNMYVAPAMDCASFGCTPTGMIPTCVMRLANKPWSVWLQHYTNEVFMRQPYRYYTLTFSNKSNKMPSDYGKVLQLFDAASFAIKGCGHFPLYDGSCFCRKRKEHQIFGKNHFQ